jgi:hypothetical protein
MRFVTFDIANSGGLKVLVNPEHVVCVVDAGDKRSQIVTTGLSGEDSISLIVQGDPVAVAAQLEGEFAILQARGGRPQRSAN